MKLSKNGKPIGRPKGSTKSAKALIESLQKGKPPTQKEAFTPSPTFGTDLIQDDAWKALNPMEQAFLYKYFVTGFDSIKAYRETLGTQLAAKQAPGVQREIASAILNKPNIVQALKGLVSYFLAERRITYIPRILSVLESQAFYDISDIIDSTGELKTSLDKMPFEHRLAITAVETKWYGKDADRSQTVVKLADRDRALERLAKYVSLFSADLLLGLGQNGPGAQGTGNSGTPQVDHTVQARVASIFAEAVSARSPIPSPGHANRLENFKGENASKLRAPGSGGTPMKKTTQTLPKTEI